MLPLTHSPFLQALGYAIINSLWQFALLWLIYVLINAALKLSSHQKYTAGLLLQVSGFIWFTATLILYFRQHIQVAQIFSIRQTALFGIAHSAVNVRRQYLSLVLQIEKFLPYLSVAYLAILIVSGIKWIKAYNLTKMLNTKGLHIIEVSWRAFVKQLAVELGIKREVKIYLSEMVKTPLTIGFFKPLILIPLASLNNLNTEQMEAVIVHELAHIRRFDYLFNLLLALIEAILFFNPFMLLISRHVKRERENCCDDWVLQYNYNAASYAHALLQIATCQSSAYLFALKAADNKQALLHRIRRMIEKKEIVFFNYRHQLIALLVVITVLGSLSVLSSLRKPGNAAASSPVKKVRAQKTSVKADEPSFYPVSTFVSPSLKSGLNSKQAIEKIRKQNLRINLSDVKTAGKNTGIGGKINTITEPEKVNTTSLVNGDEPFKEDFRYDIEMPDARAVNLFSNDVAEKGRQTALAQEKFQLAIKEFQKDQNLFNQKQFAIEMKAALEQLNAAKIQAQLSEQKLLLLKAGEDISQGNQIADILMPAIRNTDKMKSVMSQLQLQMKKAQKQYDKLSESNADGLNADLNKIEMLLHLSFDDNTHSFSYEFSDKSKAKAAPQRFLRLEKNTKKNKIFIRDEINQNEIIHPLVPAQPLQSAISAYKRLYTIKI